MSSTLENYVLAFAGTFTVTQSAVEKTAKKLGATVVKKLDSSFNKQEEFPEGSHIFCLVIGSRDVDETSKKFNCAKDNEFILLKETWLSACDEKQTALPTDEYLWSSKDEQPGGSKVKPSKNIVSNDTDEHVGSEDRDGDDRSRGEVEQNDKEQRSQGRDEDTAAPSHESAETAEPPSAHPILKSEAGSKEDDLKPSGHSRDGLGQSDKDQHSQGRDKDMPVPSQVFNKADKPPSFASVFESGADSDKGNPKAGDHSKAKSGGSRLNGFYLGTSPPAQTQPDWNMIELPEDPDSSSRTAADPVKGEILCRIHYYFLVLLPGKKKDSNWHRGVLVLASQYSKEAGRFDRNGGTTLYPKNADFLSKVNRCTDMITGVVASNIQKTRSYIIAAKPKSRDFQAFTKTTYNTRWGNRCGDHTINAARKMAGQKPLRRVQKVREDRIPGRYLRAMGGMGDDSEEDLDSEDD